MLSLKITDLKTFAYHLFVKETFDKFDLHRAVFKTAYYTEIDGKRNEDYFKDSEDGGPDSDSISWKAVRPVSYELIKGGRLPLYFKITLKTGGKASGYYQEKAGLTDVNITSLSINLTYQDEVLTLTTGVSYDGFTLEKKAEQLWDKDVLVFLEKNGLAYEDTFSDT